jgi:quercetin dioxygenase-like cupin family protein
VKLGSRINKFRKQSGLTLQKLSELTDVSVGFLSNIERDLTSPSISNLQKICSALDIDLVKLIQPDEESKTVVRAHQRRKMFYSETSKIKYELITEGNKKINGFCITMEKGADYGKVSHGHSSDELGIVIKGEMELTIDGDTYLLTEGDSIYIEANLPHSYRNLGDSECISYWVLVGKVETNY